MGQDGMGYLFCVRLYRMQMGSATCIFPLHPSLSLTMSSASHASFISSLITSILLFFNAYSFSQVTLYSYCRNNNDSVKKLSDIFLTVLSLFLLSTCTQLSKPFRSILSRFPDYTRYSETSLVHLFTHNSSHTTLAQRAYIPVTFIFVFLFLFNAQHSLIYREKGEKYDGDVK